MQEPAKDGQAMREALARRKQKGIDLSIIISPSDHAVNENGPNSGIEVKNKDELKPTDLAPEIKDGGAQAKEGSPEEQKNESELEKHYEEMMGEKMIDHEANMDGHTGPKSLLDKVKAAMLAKRSK